MKSRFWSHVIVVCALLLPAAAGMEVRAEPAAMAPPSASSPAPDTAARSSELNRLYPEEMDPPGSCGVPLGGPFGQDVEILLNDVQYNPEPGWYLWGWVSCADCLGGLSLPSSDIAAAPLDTERVVAVWREGSVAGQEGELYYGIWDASQSGGAWGPVAGGGPFTDDQGWDQPKHYATIQSGDIDGDGVDELLGRAAVGMVYYRFDANTDTWEPVDASNKPFSDAANWDHPEYYITIHTADVNGDGVDELLGRGGQGMELWRLNTNNNTWELMAVHGPFPDYDPYNPSLSWDEPAYYYPIHSGDTDGDGVDELLGRADQGMVAYRYNTSTGEWDGVAGGGPYPDTGYPYCTPLSPCTPPPESTYRTIHSADIDGDGVDELMGRTSDGMEAYRFNGSSWELVADGGPFSDAQGWGVPQYYATIQSGDIDGDGVDELLGRAVDGISVYRFDADTNTWDPVPTDSWPFPDENGWGAERYYATIHSGDMDGDGVGELLARAGDGMQAYRLSDSPGGWWDETGWLGLAPEGNPAILAIGSRHWEVYARDGGQIQYRAWENGGLGEWQTVPGTNGVASDPVVVSRRSGNTALFYRDAIGGVWFTEREGGGGSSAAGEEGGAGLTQGAVDGVWRTSPLLLTHHKVFLPTVGKAGSGAAARAAEGQPSELSGSPSVVFVSELSAISRNENHLAVFGVDSAGQLMVKGWTSHHASDWSDTQWVALMAGVAPEKPAVASRRSNHLAVAVRDTSGVAHTIEWADDTGWGEPVSLGETFAGPLTLAATDTDELFLSGLDGQKLVRFLHWTVDAGWQGPQTGLQASAQDQVIPAVVRRPGDVMFFMRTGFGWYAHYTSQGRDPTPVDRQFALPQSEFYRNQVLARVGSRSYYLAADEGTGGAWKVEAWDLDGDVPQPGLALDGHPYAAGNPVSVVAGDLDSDGSDEIVVATYNPYTATLSVLDLMVTDLNATPTLSMVVTATVTETLAAGDLSLAIGDLDGDLRRNEVVLAKTPEGLSSLLSAKAKLYQFLPGAPAELREKSDGFQTIDTEFLYGHWELEAAAGRLGYLGYDGEQLAVTITGATPGLGREWVNTYDIVAGEDPWTFDLLDGRLALADRAAVLGQLYRSALATGDLDADGYEEIAALFGDRVYVIDPNDPGEPSVSSLNSNPGERSLAVGDLDQDGRAEIAVAGWLAEENPGETGFRYALLEILGDGALAVTGYGPVQPGRDRGTVLVGDADGDGLVSTLAGCNTSGEYSVVAVVNGLPRWYENGLPVFDSNGYYSCEEGGGSNESWGTTFNFGTSVTLGYEHEFNAPFVGKVASVRASFTWDLLAGLGLSNEKKEIRAYGSNYMFDNGLGIVVYNVVDTTCYYYDVFSSEDPQQTFRAMSCKPGAGDTLVMALELWHDQSTKDAASWSWVDVGHRAPGGALTNDLNEPGNYGRVLPVDEFLLLFEFDEQRISPTGGAEEIWYARQEWGGARTGFGHLEQNMTTSIGGTLWGFSVDRSATFGVGFDHSNTESWSEEIKFGGGYSWTGGGRSYRVAPYVYQATAITEAGSTYPYWVMDYYVTDIGP